MRLKMFLPHLKPLLMRFKNLGKNYRRFFSGGSARTRDKILFTIIDYHSRFPMLYEVKSSSSEAAIKCLTHLFSLFGFPDELVSDNGTAFVSQNFSDFLLRHGIKHKRPSPYYPQANAVVERFHGTLKKRVDRMCDDGVSLDTSRPYSKSFI